MPRLSERLRRIGPRAAKDLLRRMLDAAGRVERNRVEAGADSGSYFPTVQGPARNQDRAVEEEERERLDRRRARLRRGFFGRFRNWLLGMRRAGDRADAARENEAVATEAHAAAREDSARWEQEVGRAHLVTIVPSVLTVLGLVIAGVADTLFSAGASRFLVASSAVVPRSLETPLSLLLALLFGVGMLTLTKWAVEETMLIRFSSSGDGRQAGMDPPPWAGRSPRRRLFGVAFALVTVGLVVAVSAGLRENAAVLGDAAGPQPVRGGEHSIAEEAERASSSSEEATASPGSAKASYRDFLALGLGSLLLLAAVTQFAMDPARIHAKRLRAAERRARLVLAYRRWRRQVTQRRLEGGRDADAALIRHTDVVVKNQRYSSADLMIQVADRNPGLFGNVAKEGDVPDPLRHLAFSANDMPEFPPPVDRFGPPPSADAEEGSGEDGDAA